MAKRALWIGLVSALLMVLAGGCSAVPRMASESASYDEMPPMAAPEEPRESVDYQEGATARSRAELGDVIQTRMIIYTGELSLVVADPNEAQAQVTDIIERVDGYLASANSYAYGDNLRRISLSLRVPVQAFSATMDALRALALEVSQDAIGSEDVTQEYVDLESRLNALEVKAVRLEELMEEAEDTEAVLAVYSELSETQIRIEQTKGRMQYLERHAAMSTINVSLMPDAMSRPVAVATWRPGGTARRAIESLVTTFQFLFDAAIWLVLAVAPVVAVIGVGIYLLVRVAIWATRRIKIRTSA